MSEPLALRNQKLAAEPRQSVWVAANAGAGKTHVLVHRVLRLMLDGARPERILCLTFTKAAAAEMANRLHRRLGEWAVMPDAQLGAALADLSGSPPGAADLARARRLFAATLDTPGGLKIQTIHAFCQAVLGRFPVEAGIPPHFSVLDERERNALLRRARETALEAAATGADPVLADALGLIVSESDETGFDDLMNELIAARGRLRRLLERYGSAVGVIDAIRRHLGLAPGETEGAILAAFRSASDVAGLKQAAEALSRGSRTDADKGAAIHAWLLAGEPTETTLADYVSVFVTEKGDGRKVLATKAVIGAAPSIGDILAQERARVLGFLAACRAARLHARTAALLTLGFAIVEAFEAFKRQAATLDFEDMIIRTRALLLDPGAPWVLFKLDGGIDHVLVDEAQDTSPDQWAIVEALAGEFFAGAGRATGPRTLFAVGDEKQSIYSFQGADPAYFARMRDTFAERAGASGLAWRDIELDLSFRSTPAVLKAVDAVFGRDAARAGVARPQHRVQHVAHRRSEPGLVEVWPSTKPEMAPEARPWDAPLDRLTASSADARLAREIAARVRDWLVRGEPLASTGRPIRPGDVMILVRRRNRFAEEMIRALKNANVPVAGADRMILTEQLAVMDLIALGRFLLLPEDDLNLATVLKGPLFGLTDDDLMAIAPGRRGALWSALRESGRHPDAVAELSALLDQADLVSPFALYADLLGARGGRRRIVARLGLDAADPLEQFLQLALDYEVQHPPGLQGFVHWVDRAPTEIKRDMESRADAVRVMTVHGSKGLEASIVFLPETCQTPMGSQQASSPILWSPDDGGEALPLWSARRDDDDARAAAARAARQDAQMAEYRRLLYVAMTRARDRLYVAGYETRRGRQDGCWYDLVEAALQPIAERIETPYGVTLRLADPQAASASPAARDAGEASAVPPAPEWVTAVAAPEIEPSNPLSPSRASEAEPEALSPLTDERARRYKRGLLMHRLLQTLPDLPPAARAGAAARFVAEPMHALDAHTQAQLVAEAMAVIEDPRIAAAFGPGSRAEVPLTGLIGRRAVAGQVDRIAILPDRVLVIDYKTNRPPPRKPEETPLAYRRQMALYVSLLENIYPDRPVEAVLVWTDGPIVTPLTPELLGSAMP